MKNEKIPHYGNSSKILLKIVEWSKPITHKWTTAHFPSLVQTSQKKNCYKKSLKIPKEQSESVYRRRTDKTMDKTRSLVLYVCFVDHCLSFCPFYFGHCVVCSSSIYGFWLLLWYLQALLIAILFLRCLYQAGKVSGRPFVSYWFRPFYDF
jgi:hypothetical protein